MEHGAGLQSRILSWSKSGFAQWRVLREAGFTEQRRPPSLSSGRITGLILSNPTCLSELILTGPSPFLLFIFLPS
ncbi:hypothetical protein ES288_A03G032400v1 [Gossypium darwinii]|uniref:Uncharacterized protein n=1 Tax=Gossypium darwinii TaxID=34276 RepID=A0A5D2H0J5_GOSDA|nr:hypothetical protein ES288_A03G032400v1 [Gossypium darwinii]